VPSSLADSTPSDEAFRNLVLSSADDQWTAVYSKVSGELPLDELVPKAGEVLYLRGSIAVDAAGQVGIQVNDVAGLDVWIGDRRVEPSEKMVVELSQGEHPVTLRIDMKKRNTKIVSAVLFPVDGSTAVASVGTQVLE
jgi:hypothetical protein